MLATRPGESIQGRLLTHSAAVSWRLYGVQHPWVRIGSYPKGQEGDYTVKLTVEGREAALVAAAVRAIEAEIAVDRTETH